MAFTRAEVDEPNHRQQIRVWCKALPCVMEVCIAHVVLAGG